MADDDRALRDKLALLEAEVKADIDALNTRKAAALDKVREQRAAQQAPEMERAGRGRAGTDVLRARQAESATRKKPRDQELDQAEGIGGALELAGQANRVKTELARKPAKGEKSWIKSGLASAALGPIGWLYAGSMREAIPASAVWLTLLTIASKILPMVLVLPVLMVVLPLSGIAGVVYALQYNRHGGRQRLFDKEQDKPKQLPGG